MEYFTGIQQDKGVTKFGSFRKAETELKRRKRRKQDGLRVVRSLSWNTQFGFLGNSSKSPQVMHHIFMKLVVKLQSGLYTTISLLLVVIEK